MWFEPAKNVVGSDGKKFHVGDGIRFGLTDATYTVAVDALAGNHHMNQQHALFTSHLGCTCLIRTYIARVAVCFRVSTTFSALLRRMIFQ